MSYRATYRSVVLFSFALLQACTQEESRESTAGIEPAASQILNVYAVNYPVAYFAERIAGGRAKISFPAPPDVDPANWSPDAQTIGEYQQADLIILNGAGYAGWVAKAALPRSRFVNTTAMLTDRLIRIENVVTHSHGPAAEHSHSGMAFTTWLDFDIAIEQARSVLERLVRARPTHEAEFRQAYTELEADLQALDERLMKVAEKLGERPLLFSHPVYQYLQKRYGLNGVFVHWEPDAMPEDGLWDELRVVLQEHAARVMIWEAEPLPATKQGLREMGIECVVFQTGGNRPATGDWLGLMQKGIADLDAAAAM